MRSILMWVCLGTALIVGGCGRDDIEVKVADDPKAPAAPTSAGVPSDEQLMTFMKERMSGAISVELSNTGSGEIVWSGRDLTW